MDPLFDKVDCLSLRVGDLDAALRFYSDDLGHELIWRSEKAAGLKFPDSNAELVLHTEDRLMETDLAVASVPEALERFTAAGGQVFSGPFDIPIGLCAVVGDPWGNVLVLLDASKGLLKVDHAKQVIEIREARADDAPRLTGVAHAAKRHWGYPDDLIALWRGDLTVTPELIGSHPVFCATKRGEIVGFYALSNDGMTFDLEHMWVDPSHIGKGVGRILFEHAVTAVASLGGTVVRIASDPNAVGFYERMGATHIGESPSTPPGRTLPLLQLEVS